MNSLIEETNNEGPTTQKEAEKKKEEIEDKEGKEEAVEETKEEENETQAKEAAAKEEKEEKEEAAKEESTPALPTREKLETRTRQSTVRYKPHGDEDGEEDDKESLYKSDSESSSVEVMPTAKKRGRNKRQIKKVLQDGKEEEYDEIGNDNQDNDDNNSDEQETLPPLVGEEVVGRRVIVLFDMDNKSKRVPYMGRVVEYEVNLKEKPQKRRKKSHLGLKSSAGGKKKPSMYSKKIQRLFRVVFVDGDDMWLDLSELKREGRLWFQDAV